ncbi:MAG: replication and repair protein RecF [Thermomicrobiales bacterium]|jgi:DNA replication and repair protein RecF|nr:replication and repair protein RecF [Thermomicrobiales bacterium]MEA2531429.1 replication and repair protein RecF [Thermomicrobiales bacterium]
MQLRRLLLEEFRLYHHLELELGPAGLALHGANASGKSTLLEAIAMLATTRSARSGGEREVINWRSGQELGFPPFARVRGHVERLDDEVDVEIALQLDAGGSGQLQKAIRLNGRNVRAMDAVGSLKTVLFAPEDVALVSGSPSGRRRYLDLMISQVDGRYLRALSRYNRILEQRNSLLKSLGREGVSANSPTAAAQLAFWDEELVAFGSRLVARRMLSIRSLAAHAAERFATFGDERVLAVEFRPSIDDPSCRATAESGDPDSTQAVIARAFSEQLQELRRDEMRRGVSLVGPHRDDFSIAIDGMDVGTFGSRGQQRLAVVALKLAETDVMMEESGERPVILLDDVLSELDPRRRDDLTQAVVALDAQVVVTATDVETIDRSPLSALPRAEVTQGAIRT